MVARVVAPVVARAAMVGRPSASPS
jgi:hypothetical protein